MLQYLGLLLVVMSWLSGAFAYYKLRHDRYVTISQSAASSRQASRFFIAILVGYGGLFYLWLVGWFAPHLLLGNVFIILLTTTIVLQFLTAVTLGREGRQQQVHRLAAYAMAGLYIPLAVLIASSPRISDIAQHLAIIGAAYMIISFLLVALLKKIRGHYLLFEVLYIVTFQLIILAAAYL